MIIAMLSVLSAWSGTVSAAEPLLLVANKHDDTLSIVDPTTCRVGATIPVGHNPHEVVITPDGRLLFASNYDPPGDTISVVDLVQRRLIRQIPTGASVRIHGAAMAPDGSRAYFTAGQSGEVVEIDTRTLTVTRRIATGGKISHMVEVSPDGRRLYTANIDSRDVSVIDRATGELITRIPCDAGCEGFQFTPDGRRLWAGNHLAGNITIIDTATHEVVETIPCPGMPLRIRFTRDGKRALVSNWVKEGEVVVIDATTRREIGRVRVGNQPVGLLLSPDDSTVIAASMSSDELHVIDLDSLKVVRRFETGKGPDALAWWTPPESPERRGGPEPVRLFNGRDLTGFRTFLKDHGRDSDPHEVFSVRDGLLRVSGQDWGYLVTLEEYENYHLTAEYRWGERTWPPREANARDGGILLHSIGTDGAYSGVWMHSIEVQIIEGGTGDLLVVGDATPRLQLTATVDASGPGPTFPYRPGGKPLTLEGRGRIDWWGRDPAWEDTRGFRGRKDVEKPVGEWNLLECIAVGDTLTVLLNGQVVNRCYAMTPRRGRIQIQSESAEISFRRLELLPLEPSGRDR